MEAEEVDVLTQKLGSTSVNGGTSEADVPPPR